MELYETLEKLVSILSVSGREKALNTYIADTLRPYADSVTTDALGNVFVLKKGSAEHPKKIMFAAHTDEVGFMVNYIDDKGWLRVSMDGYPNCNAAGFAPVVFENGMKGALIPEDGVGSGFTADKFVLDIGVSSKEEAEKLVKIGDVCAIVPELHRLAGNRIAGRPIDNKIGAAILMKVCAELKNNVNDIYFVFTVQEEVGERGSRVAAFTVQPDIGFAVDVCTTGDIPGSKPFAVSLGGGAGIKVKDNTVICDPDLVENMVKIAEENGVKYQYELLNLGGTDAETIQSAGRGAVTGAVSIPLRNLHTAVEVIDMDDAAECEKLVMALSLAKDL